jgi:hypothetical protein
MIESIPGRLEDLKTVYSRLIATKSIADLILISFALVLTFAALLLVTAWQTVWKIAWKLYIIRKLVDLRLALMGFGLMGCLILASLTMVNL